MTQLLSSLSNTLILKFLPNYHYFMPVFVNVAYIEKRSYVL